VETMLAALQSLRYDCSDLGVTALARPLVS
jgi:hypothetical protein